MSLRNEGISAVQHALDRLADSGVGYGARTTSAVTFDAVVEFLRARQEEWAKSVRPGLPIYDNLDLLLAALEGEKS